MIWYVTVLKIRTVSVGNTYECKPWTLPSTWADVVLLSNLSSPEYILSLSNKKWQYVFNANETSGPTTDSFLLVLTTVLSDAPAITKSQVFSHATDYKPARGLHNYRCLQRTHEPTTTMNMAFFLAWP